MQIDTIGDLKGVTLNVEIKISGKLRWRMTVAKLLIVIAAKVLGCDVRFKGGDGDEEQSQSGCCNK